MAGIQENVPFERCEPPDVLMGSLRDCPSGSRQDENPVSADHESASSRYGCPTQLFALDLTVKDDEVSITTEARANFLRLWSALPHKNVRNTELDAILKLLIRDYRPKRIIIHGPHATNSAAPDDELGLLIIKETTERPIYRCVSIRKILARMADSPPLDILVLTENEFRTATEGNDPYLQHILGSGEEVYAG